MNDHSPLVYRFAPTSPRPLSRRSSRSSSRSSSRPAAKLLLLAALLAGCAQPLPRPSDYHLGRPDGLPGRSVDPALAPGIVGADGRDGDVPGVQGAGRTGAARADAIPPLVNGPAPPPRPRNGPRLETYSVVVTQLEIGELLFAMARDARLNLDVHPGLRGKVSINAIDQTLPQILSRLSRQVPLRYEFDGRNLVVMPDAPFVRHYTIDYVNLSRDARSQSSIATQIATPGAAGGGSGASGAGNNSTTEIVNVSVNRFWETLVENVRSLVEGDEARAPQQAVSGAPPDARGQGQGQVAGGAGGNASGGASGGAAGKGAVAAAQTGGGPKPGNGSQGGAGAPGGGGQGGGGQGGGGQGGGSVGASAQSSVTANPEVGLLTVRATSLQHDRIQAYIDRVMRSARRQVLIEATVAEVQLSEQFQQGINWQSLKLDGTGFGYVQQPGGPLPLPSGATPGAGPGGIVFPPHAPSGGQTIAGASTQGGATPSLGVLRYLDPGKRNFAAAISLLQSFGKVKVLSSPKISVLNNQTALLKVVDNRVYFTIGVQVTPGTAGAAPVVSYTSTPNTVPVGFVMSVTPQIEGTGTVTMNVRPTISRIVGFVNDPNPELSKNNVVSRVPEIQTREMESILKVGSGDVAVMGGLMQESVDDRQDMVPGAAAVPWLGQLFRYRNDSSSKTELVVFLRPIVIRDASMDGDFRHLKSLLPKEDFFNTPVPTGIPRAWSREGGGL